MPGYVVLVLRAMSDVEGRPRRWLGGIDHLLRIKRDQLAFYDELRARYGDAVRLRLGPYRSWILFHPDQVEALLTERWASFIRFRKLTEVIAQWNGDSLLLAEGEVWRERRRKVMAAFQTKRLPGYGAIAVEHAARLADRFSREADGDGVLTFDTDASMARLTLDIAAGTLFGATAPANGDEVEEALQVLSDTAFRESTSPVVLPDWLPLASKRRKHSAMRVMNQLVVSLVERGLTRGARDQGDLLSMLIDQHRGDARAIRDDAMSLLIAGHETSGALLSWCFVTLTDHPSWLERILDEIDVVLGGRTPTSDDLGRLKTVRAVIEEVLRLYPPAYSLFLRQATEDVDLAGVAIRAGDLVQIVPYSLQRDPRWFPDPARFDPNRFLAKPTWPRYAYIPFGAGPRVCIGQSFALTEACLVVATLLQRWVPEQAERTPVLNAKFSLRPREGLPMRWRRRT